MVRKVQTLRPRSMRGVFILKSQRSLIFILISDVGRPGPKNVKAPEATRSRISCGSQAQRQPIYDLLLFVFALPDGAL
ncbi:hypothetical protein FHR70_000840 [Microvirga lupini]|uniref:Uncharacterized protein n=1 Tax=Microvirga lupini TaxID=420324 RepID=A0A7W4VIE8_9HYPH|nr:hypothetical protein [Microvirga lupini]